MVQTVKGLLSRSDDTYLAMLIYRTTPLPWCGYSPAELLQGRMMWTNIPMLTERLMPKLPHYTEFKECDKKFKQLQKSNYDSRHGVHQLPSIPDDSDVWVTTERGQTSGQVVSRADTPRSYMIQTDGGTMRKNRHHLTVVPNTPVTQHQEWNTNVALPSPVPTRSNIVTRSKTGTVIRSPQRFTGGDVGHEIDT